MEVFMSSKPTASMMERRHPETTHIDILTLDMLTLLHKDDKRIADAVEACLPAIARLMDNATATLSRGGRLVIVGAGASGQAAAQAVSEPRRENIRWSGLLPEGDRRAAGDGNRRESLRSWRFRT
jgi:N-acetylmuramic acid 6-phosphate etherase